MTKRTFCFFIYFAIILLWQAPAYPQLNLDFNVPVPEDARLADTKDFSFAGRRIKSLLYNSDQGKPALAAYYEKQMAKQGFARVKDQAMPAGNARMLRFKKEDLVVDIYLKSRMQKSDIIISKYLEPPGSAPLDKENFSAKDLAFAFPDKDLPGEDSKLIPRPPQGIRMFAQPGASRGMLMYTSPLNVERLREFYKAKMPEHSWQLDREFPLKEGLELYKRAGGKSKIPNTKILGDGPEISKVIADSYELYFRGNKGFAEIIISPNFLDPNLGSIVTINLEQGG
ncbi:MAG: hypothetical protein PHF11_02175 [Candidatus Omnitrophica bacterium]|nr:hypothetical protein [Candidatus Omnitrophota bacterium]